ncbi:SH3-like domain-containing protein [Bacillus firmus]|uniref:peptidoglycan recognition protein family protein n=1 Tax=Cytobacillus firmus TaxID=1399 RepID=UPI00158001B4|nr:GW dipeptide domain-containing protein [Cytobacillus firmus]NUH85492.1 SH3-like domain-containing protein [Cytobacillus firmus]
MKKAIIAAAAILLYTSIVPSHLLANENAEADKVQEIESEVNLESQSVEEKESAAEAIEEVKEPSQSKEILKTEEKISNNDSELADKYNELGIKAGTEVYGEDISTLSKEELQYVPEGWRDGEFESEHQDGNKRMSLFSRSVYPDVNDYIISNKLSSAKIEYSHMSNFPKFGYRNGDGMVEGVVAHETANDNSSITGEINYMMSNYNNAFVHAFVDHSRIIEIHPPDYAAWGAGRFANERFAHVELVRVNTFDQFARSINNYSDYIVSLLYKYNLGVWDAERNGNGSLWTHDAVSKFLGGTNHVDPHGYFAKWGYNWDEFVELVVYKHNKLPIKKENTSRLGHLRSEAVRIYNNIDKRSSSFAAGTKYTHAVYYIKKQAFVNGQVHYLISSQPSSVNGVIGWVKGSDLSSYEHTVVDKKAKTLYIKGTGSSYSKAWGGRKDIIHQSLTSFKNKEFKVHLTEKAGSNVWYRGELDRRVIWIHSNYILSKEESKTSRLGHLKSENVRIFRDIGDESSSFTAGLQYTHAVYYIKKQAVVGRETYYYISQLPSSEKGTVGWVRASDLSTKTHTVIDKDPKTFNIEGTGSAYSKAWGGKKDVVFEDLSKYKDQEFKVHLTEKAGNDTWYRGELDGEIVWILSSRVSKGTLRLGHLRNENVKVYKEPGNGSSDFPAGEKLTNTVYEIKKQTIDGGKLYYLLSKAGKDIGWVNELDLSAVSYSEVIQDAKTLYISGTGSAYSEPWGGKKDIIYASLFGFKEQEIAPVKIVIVGTDIWYQIELGQKSVWISSRYATELVVSKISRLGHLINSDVKIYKSPGSKSSFTSAANYTHAVYYIKKQAVIGEQKYYLISLQPSSVNGIVGWVRASDLSTAAHTVVNKESKTFYIKGDGSAYSKAWGGRKDLVYRDLSVYKDQVFRVHLTENTGSDVWYRGDLDGKTVWVHSKYVSSAEESRTSLLGHLRSENAKIYKSLGDESSFLTAGADYTNAVYYIKKQAIVNGKTHYLISKQPSSVNGIVGWVKKSDLSIAAHTGVDKKAKTYYVTGTGSAYSKAWGGRKDLVYQSLVKYKNHVFKVHLTEKVGSDVWYRGTLDGQTVWLHNSLIR